MVIIYNFSTHILQRWQTHAPHLLANLMAMGMHQYGTEHIDQCAMLSASIEATRRRNWLIICCVSPKVTTWFTDKQAHNKANTSIAGHFWWPWHELIWYQAHCLMQHIQGFNWSHWTLLSGECLLSLVMPYNPKLQILEKRGSSSRLGSNGRQKQKQLRI